MSLTIPVGADTSAALSRLSADTTYYWQVRAVNPAGATEADSGARWDFTTPPAVSAGPLAYDAHVVDDGAITSDEDVDGVVELGILCQDRPIPVDTALQGHYNGIDRRLISKRSGAGISSSSPSPPACPGLLR